MAPDLTGAADTLIMADGGAQAAAGGDPAAIVEVAVEVGVAAPDYEREPTPPEKAALVRHWWDRTAETADFKAAVDRQVKDIEVLEGGTSEEVDDAAEVTINHVYRNAVQGVALCAPDVMKIEWKPREEVKPLPGTPIPPEVIARRRQQQGLASVMTVLFRRFAEMGNLEEKFEALIQDSFHFRIAIAKVWWQRSLASDPLGESRLPDEQDLLARARVLVELYDRGEFSKQDPQYEELRNCLKSIGRTEADVKRGIVVELRPLAHYRCDPSVTGPEYHDTAAWESDDVCMTRDEILAKWSHIKPEDLERCAVYSLDETGRAIRRDREDRTTTTREVHAVRQLPDTRPRSDDWLLCREIYDYETNTRLVLVEGLDFPAVEEPIERGPTGMSPFVPLIENRRSGSFYGFSDTEFQAKPQRQLNRLRSQEEDARRNAQPRWAISAQADPHNDVQRAMEAPPGTITPVRTVSAKSLQDEMVNLAGNHEFNPVEFDGSKIVQEMRKMAMLPEQASGELGQAEFATEVQVAAAGANALARYRQKRILRAIKKLLDKIAQLVLLNVNQDLAIRYAGPMAALYYPQHPMDRREVYDGLTISVDVSMDRALDYNRRAEALARLIEAFAKTGVQFDREVAAKLLARFMDLGDEADDLVKADPNDLVSRLMAAVQADPQSLAPEAAMVLVQLGQAAQQISMQAAMAQQQTQPSGAQQMPPAAQPGA